MELPVSRASVALRVLKVPWALRVHKVLAVRPAQWAKPVRSVPWVSGDNRVTAVLEVRLDLLVPMAPPVPRVLVVLEANAVP